MSVGKGKVMARERTNWVRAARLALACALLVGGPAGADAPDPAAAPVDAPPVAQAVETTPAGPPPAVRDRLMEIVVQYLDVAFVREAREERTAQLQPMRESAVRNQ